MYRGVASGGRSQRCGFTCLAVSVRSSISLFFRERAEIQISQVVLRERCDPAAAFACRRRLLTGRQRVAACGWFRTSLAICAGLIPMDARAAVCPPDRTYTVNADFDEGSSISTTMCPTNFN